MVPSNRGHKDAMHKALGQMRVPGNMVRKAPDVVQARKVPDAVLVLALVPDVALAPVLAPDAVQALDLVPDVVLHPAHHLVPVRRADRY